MYKSNLISGGTSKLESLKTAAKQMLDAVTHRDIKTFTLFLDPTTPFYALLPMGEFSDIDSYLRIQDRWFDGSEGSFNYEFEHFYLSGDLGSITVRAIYQDTSIDGIPFRKEIIITDLLQYIDEKWILVFSQNSVLKSQTVL